MHRFLKKFWRLFNDAQEGLIVTDELSNADELKILHKTILKVGKDTEELSYNTAISSLMICVNELNDLNCHKKEILEKILLLLAPYAPHICEELWQMIGMNGSVFDAPYPIFDNQYVVEDSKEYPIAINGKLRTKMMLSMQASQEEAEQLTLSNPVIRKWLDGKPIKKIIFVKGKMINIVV